MVQAETTTFPSIVKAARKEFFVLYAPVQLRKGEAGFSAVIRWRRTGCLRLATYSYTLSGPSRLTLSADYASREELVARMISDNLDYNEGRCCWVEL